MEHHLVLEVDVLLLEIAQSLFRDLRREHVLVFLALHYEALQIQLGEVAQVRLGTLDQEVDLELGEGQVLLQ